VTTDYEAILKQTKEGVEDVFREWCAKVSTDVDPGERAIVAAILTLATTLSLDCEEIQDRLRSLNDE